MDLPFDNVVVQEGGESRAMTVEEFLALDLPTRIRCVMSRGLQFRRGAEVIDKGAALAALQQASARRRRVD